MFTYSGQVNQGGWELVSNAGDEFARINPQSYFHVGPTPAVTSGLFQNPSDLQGPDNFGPVDSDSFASSGNGDLFGLNFSSGLLRVPGGYVRNTPISGTSTYSGETFASLGMAPGSYTWSWDTLPFAVGRDSVTLNVVPEPSSILLIGLGLVSIGVLTRRRTDRV